jgi:hypothetical protein
MPDYSTLIALAAPVVTLIGSVAALFGVWLTQMNNRKTKLIELEHNRELKEMELEHNRKLKLLDLREQTARTKGVSLTTEDPTRLLLIQGEADRVRRIAEKRSSHPVGGGRVGDYLRGEYKRGVEELSGAEAQAVCAGTLRVAAELGVSEEEIVGPLRTDQQRQRLDDARRLYYFSDMFSKDAPAPPKALARAARRDVGMQRSVFCPVPRLRSLCKRRSRATVRARPRRRCGSRWSVKDRDSRSVGMLRRSSA